MNITKVNVTKYYLTDLKGLDSISVIVENYKLGHGKIMIECYGRSWAYTWTAMGEHTIEEFFVSCDDGYLTGKLFSGTIYQVDWDKIAEASKAMGLEPPAEGDGYSDYARKVLREVYGDDWNFALPQKLNPDYEYLMRIVQAVKEGLQQILVTT